MLRLFAAFVFVVSVLSPAAAQTWNNYIGGDTNWTTAANWVGGVAPTSSISTILTFTSTPPQTVPLPATVFQPTGGYTSTNNTGTFVLNQMVFNAYGSPDTASPGVTIAAVSGGGVSFQGTSPQLTQNGSGAIVFADAAVSTTEFQIPTTLTIGGSGAGHISIPATVSGAGSLTINRTDPNPLFSGSQLILTSGGSNSNTFSGGTTLLAGNVGVNNTGVSLGTGPITVAAAGTSFRSSGNNPTLSNAITLNARMNISGGGNFTISGPTSGSGGIQVAFSNTGNFQFNGNYSGTGDIIVDGIGAATNTFAISAFNGGSALNTSAFTIVGSNFSFNNNNTGLTPVTRLNPAATMNLSGATANFQTGSNAVTAEAVATTNLAGGNTYIFSSNPAVSTQFNGGILNRTGNATFLVNSGSGQTFGGTPGAAGNNTLQFGDLSGQLINGVLPYGFAVVQEGANSVGTLVRYTPTNGIVPLNTTTDYLSSTQDSFNTIISNPTANFRVVAARNLIEASTNSPQLNSILIETNSASAIGGAIYGSGTITLTSGVLATSLVNGSTQPVAAGTTISKDLAFSTTGYLHAQANTTLLGSVSGANGFVKAGTGTLQLLGANTFVGGLSINAGTVQFSQDASLGAAGGVITIGGGALSFQTNALFDTTSPTVLSLNRSISISARSIIDVASGNQSLVLAGGVSGTGRFVKTGSGTLLLTSNNTYTGDTVILGGAIVAASDNALGNTSSSVILSSTSATSAAFLQVNANVTSARNLLITSGTAGANGIFVNGGSSVFTLTGNIGGSGIGIPFLKAGDGTLGLSAANNLNGAVTIGDATPTRRPSASAATTGGTVTLGGVNGSLAQATAYTVNNGSTLTIDNTAAPNFNRLSSSVVTMNGAEFRMIGNPTSATFEHVGRDAANGLVSNSLGNIITLTQPTGNNNSTNLVLTGYTATGSAMTFFRGNGLGSPTGDFTRIIFATAPTPVNSLIPGALVANTSNGTPTDFATYASSTNGVEAFTAYVTLPSINGSNTQTHLAANNLTFSGSVSSNALKMTGASITLAGNTLSFAGNAGMILSTGADSLNGGTVAFGVTPARVSVNSTLTIGAVLTGSSGLNKFGPGTLELGNSSLTGEVAISGGTLKLTTAAGHNGNALNMQRGATFDLNGSGTLAIPVTASDITGFGTISIGTGALRNTAASTTAFGGSFTGTGDIVHDSTSNNTMTYNGSSPAFTGGVTIRSGRVELGTADALGTSGSLQLGDTGVTTNAFLSFANGVNTFSKSITVPNSPATTVAVQFNGTASVVAVSGPVAVDRQLTITGASGSVSAGTNTFSGVVSGNGSLLWTGGNVSFTGNNTFVGGITLSAARCILGVGSDTALGTGIISIADVANPGTFRAEGGARTLANAITFAGNTTPTTIGFTGTNNLTFTTGSINLGSVARTFEVTSTGRTVFQGQFIGSASLTKTGAGLLRLQNAGSTFSGGFTLRGGVLAFAASTVGSPGNVTSGPIGTGTLTIDGCDIRAEGGPQVINNDIVLSSDLSVDGMNDITLGGTIIIGTTTRRIVIINSSSTNLSNTITGTGGIIKDGPGTLTLSGDNSAGFTGGTSIEEGKIIISNNTGSGLPTVGTTTVRNNGKLQGNGSIAATVDVEAGGEFGGGISNSPAVGKLTSTAGAIRVRAGAALLVGISASGSPAGSGSFGTSSGGTPEDPANNNFFLQTGGSFTMDAGSKITVDLRGTHFDITDTRYSYGIAKLSTDQSGFSFDPANVNFVFDGPNEFINVSLFGNASGFIYLNFTPTPEPLGVLTIAMLGLVVRRRLQNRI